MSYCFCTLAIHKKYRAKARRLCLSLLPAPCLVLTDEPADFADLPVRVIQHQPTGPMARDYLSSFRPTGNGQGAAAYHDKRFAIQAVLRDYDTAIFLDADSVIDGVPDLSAFPPGLCIIPVVRRNVQEHLAACGAWRLPAFQGLALDLAGSTDILSRARWCHESIMAVTRDDRGGEDQFLSIWGQAAAIMQGKQVYSGEGGVIGLAADLVGWQVNDTALSGLADHLSHQGGGPKDDLVPSLARSASDVAFVLCVEDNAILPQAILLIESIRAFAGAYRDSEILAISPRGMGVGRDIQGVLRMLGVRYVDLPLNTACPEYGSANRIYAGQWAAQHTSAPNLIVLDSDTLFLAEPCLPNADWDVAARPVDVKGSTTKGYSDPLDEYWRMMCQLGGMDISALPWTRTAIDGEWVRASYNGGYLVVRRESGVLERAAELFTHSVELGMRPLKDKALDIQASTGRVGKVASEYWGSNQAALSVAMWSSGARVSLLPPSYNIPLHCMASCLQRWTVQPPVHVHYHWGFDPEHIQESLRLLKELGVPPDQWEWIRCRTPLVVPNLP